MLQSGSPRRVEYSLRGGGFELADDLEGIMTDEALNLHEWQDDGHTVALRLCLFNGREGNFGRVKVDVTCPDDSSCRKWQKAHDAPTPLCFVQLEIENMSDLDFVDSSMNTETLPDDWSANEPVTIEWRELGEDGLEWRPKVTT